MGPISVSGTVIIRPGTITGLLTTGTGVPTIGPTGITITGRTITQPADITIRDVITVGIAHAVITSATAIGDTGAPGTVTIGTGTGLTAVITGANIVSCRAISSFRPPGSVLSEVKNLRYSRGHPRP